MEINYPNLQQFFGCYFHEDWPVEFADDREAVATFLNNATPTNVDAVRAELRSLVSRIAASSEPSRVLWKLGCYYLPAAEGESIEAWLTIVLKQMEGEAEA